MKLLNIIIALILLFNIYGTVNSENNSFVATNKWQEIREGQGIPAGLHVRINLQTGKKEAKLINEAEEENNEMKNEKTPSTAPENVSETPPSKGTALKTLPKESLVFDYTPEKTEYKKKIKDSSAGKKNFQNDARIITGLISEYLNISKSEHDNPRLSKNDVNVRKRILEWFNDLVHQIDNALHFVEQGGLDKVLLPLIVNQTDVGLRVHAMRILGALTINNPKVQVKVFEHNFGSHLSQILISSTNTEELSTALYALGGLLRQFPLAQHRILSTYGAQALIAVLNKKCELKIKTKAVTLINDMLVEKELVLYKSNVEDDALTIAQYAELNFPQWLQINSYCPTIDAVITTNLYTFLEQSSEWETFAHTLENANTFCFAEWSQSPQLRHTLLTLKNRFTSTQETYQLEAAQRIEKFLATLYGDNDGKIRDEL